MRHAKIFFHQVPAGILTETDDGRYVFEYLEDYQGPSISLRMPKRQRRFLFEGFPPFFDGLLPEGPQLEALLRQAKLDRNNYLGQLITLGADLVGAVSVERFEEPI